MFSASLQPWCFSLRLREAKPSQKGIRTRCPLRTCAGETCWHLAVALPVGPPFLSGLADEVLCIAPVCQLRSVFKTPYKFSAYPFFEHRGVEEEIGATPPSRSAQGHGPEASGSCKVNYLTAAALLQ